MPTYRKKFASLNRRSKVILQVLLDASLVGLSFFAAMLFRLESTAFMGKSEVWAAHFFALTIAIFAFRWLGLYRALVRFITGRILFTVGKGALLAAVALYFSGLAIDARIPHSVPVIYAMLVFLSVGGVRFIARTFVRRHHPRNSLA